MRISHCIWALLLALGTAVPAGAQGATGGETRGFTIFFQGAAVGSENVLVEDDGETLVITSQGRLEAPFDVDLRFAEVRYLADGTPQTLSLESMVQGAPSLFDTVFSGGAARTTGIEGDADIDRSDPVSPRPVVLAPGFFGAYEAVTRRLAGASVGTEIRAYAAPQAEVALRVTAIATDRIETPSETIELRRYDVVLSDPAGDVEMSLSAEADGALARLAVPSQGLEVLRNDLASPLARAVLYSHPGDERVTLPGDGFTLGATLTRPDAPGPRPAVILLSGLADRDGLLNGVPTLGHLAGALADAGFLVVRYDRRGSGQSGGRAESADLDDHAADARAVFRWLEDRDDVARDRIALVGVGDGAWLALRAAAEERDVAAVVAVGAPSAPGSDFVLEQQTRAFDAAGLGPQERQAQRDLQLRIHDAVLGRTGWDGIDADIRRRADTPWFQSYLSFDPAEQIEDIRAALLFVGGGADAQVPAAHAARLAELARAEGRAASAEAVTIDGMDAVLGRAGAPGAGVHEQLLTTVTSWLAATLAR